tara:strand:+ start:11 stop:1246 length:1236 start_codon:yes stop_codon:yes gene_type:complete
MGSVAKVVKKVTRSIKRPVSKIVKGVARGIAKVGKAVMRGVGKLGKKLGPMGMIGLAIAMPYAMGGLSNAIGGAWTPAGTSGWMGSKNVFVRAIGNVGNQIRTGYQAVSKTVSGLTRGITDSISQGFSNMGKGNNIFSRISNGAKDLFKNSRLASKQMGSVDVAGWGGPAGGASTYGNYAGISTQMTSGQAVGLLDASAIEGSQLSAQTFGKTNWLTKANKMDKAVTEAINKTYKENVMSTFNESAKTAFNHYEKAAINSGEQFNYQQINKMMEPSFEFSGPTSKYTDFNFAKSGDFHLANPNEPTSYVFNGNKSYKVNGKSTLEKVKSAAKGSALDAMKKSLLTPSAHVDAFNLPITLGDMTQETSGATTFGGTTIQGSAGGSLLEGVYNKDAQERILNYYRHMNIIGSQ